MKRDGAWLILLKGSLMGAVELIPGVSAGTIALITGVLPRLIAALKNFNLTAIVLLRKEGVTAAWRYIDGNFLCLLLLGMVVGLLLLIRAIHFALEQYAIFMWSFFFGLIFASAFWIALQIKQWKRWDVPVLFILGVGFAFYITVASPLYIPLNGVNVFFVAMLAISAMMMPGLSGSFTLMLLGLYQPILAALKAFDLSIILPFLAGAGIGIVAFSHVLSFLFHRFPTQIYACLTGVMLGSLNRIWPWQEVTKIRVGDSDEAVVMLSRSVSPAYYEQMSGESAHLVYALALMVLGALLVVVMSKLEGLLGTVENAQEQTHSKNIAR